MKKYSLSALFFIFVLTSCSKNSTPVVSNQPNSRDDASSTSRTSDANIKKKGNSFRKAFYTNMVSAEEQYKKRMKDAVKQREIMEREMRKPQYSDFSYFGHKRKPKIHSLKKRKFCKECGIVH